MTTLLAAGMALVAAFSAARVLVPGLRDEQHRSDVEVWHGVMAASMGAMLLASFPGGLSTAAVAVFSGGVVWCLVQGLRLTDRAPYARLAVCCAAMVAMLGLAGGSAHGGRLLPGVWLVALVVALGVVVLFGSRQLTTPHRSAVHRVGSAGEVLVAAAMAHMVLMA